MRGKNQCTTPFSSPWLAILLGAILSFWSSNAVGQQRGGTSGQRSSPGAVAFSTLSSLVFSACFPNISNNQLPLDSFCPTVAVKQKLSLFFRFLEKLVIYHLADDMPHSDMNLLDAGNTVRRDIEVMVRNSGHFPPVSPR